MIDIKFHGIDNLCEKTVLIKEHTRRDQINEMQMDIKFDLEEWVYPTEIEK